MAKNKIRAACGVVVASLARALTACEPQDRGDDRGGDQAGPVGSVWDWSPTSELGIKPASPSADDTEVTWKKVTDVTNWWQDLDSGYGLLVEGDGGDWYIVNVPRGVWALCASEYERFPDCHVAQV